MQLRLDFHEREPIYLQIVEQVKSMVASGILKPGDQLPTVREVAADLRINFNTAARAYRLLHDEGMISTQQGRGTYVLEAPPPAEAEADLNATGCRPWSKAGWRKPNGSASLPRKSEKVWQEYFHRWTKD